MDLYDYWKKVSPERFKKVIERSGTSLAYARQLYKCRRRPSVQLATRLVELSKKDSLGRAPADIAILTLGDLLKTDKDLEKRRKQLIERKGGV